MIGEEGEVSPEYLWEEEMGTGVFSVVSGG